MCALQSSIPDCSMEDMLQKENLMQGFCIELIINSTLNLLIFVGASVLIGGCVVN